MSLLFRLFASLEDRICECKLDQMLNKTTYNFWFESQNRSLRCEQVLSIKPNKYQTCYVVIFQANGSSKQERTLGLAGLALSVPVVTEKQMSYVDTATLH